MIVGGKAKKRKFKKLEIDCHDGDARSGLSDRVCRISQNHITHYRVAMDQAVLRVLPVRSASTSERQFRIRGAPPILITLNRRVRMTSAGERQWRRAGVV